MKCTTAPGHARLSNRVTRGAIALCSAFTTLCGIVAEPAAAALGGSPRTIEADRAHLAASISSRSTTTHTVHALAMPNGSVVREFVNNDGVVFAVTWRGPGRPDLRQLLGGAFDTFQATVAGPDSNTAVASNGAVAHHGRLRRGLVFEQRNLVVHSAGHPGAFFGFACLPQQTPAGFSPDALQ